MNKVIIKFVFSMMILTTIICTFSLTSSVANAAKSKNSDNKISLMATDNTKFTVDNKKAKLAVPNGKNKGNYNFKVIKKNHDVYSLKANGKKFAKQEQIKVTVETSKFTISYGKQNLDYPISNLDSNKSKSSTSVTSNQQDNTNTQQTNNSQQGTNSNSQNSGQSNQQSGTTAQSSETLPKWKRELIQQAKDDASGNFKCENDYPSLAEHNAEMRAGIIQSGQDSIYPPQKMVNTETGQEISDDY